MGELISKVLAHAWAALDPLGKPRALMGGMALAAWNYPRSTRDVDLLIGVGQSGIDDLVESMRREGCEPKHSPPVLTVGSHHFVQFLFTPPDEIYEIQLDLLLAETELQRTALNRRVTRAVPETDKPIEVLSCDDIVLFKLVAGRIIDRADVAMLLRENRDDLDMDYLADWISRLGLATEFAEVWEEAFPGETFKN